VPVNFPHEKFLRIFDGSGVESDTRLRMLHLGLKEFGNESGHHFPECSTLLLCADEFDGVRDLVHVTFQGSLQ
jgi:hypothetical protein